MNTPAMKNPDTSENLRSLRIIYMGTPGFAMAPLIRLLDAGCHIVAVVTAPDRPAGRGKKIRPSAVKEYALEKGIQVLQPEKLKDPQFVDRLTALTPDLQVVVAFRMLPAAVWSIPKLGTFNLHASLLPQYRGAAPINHAIMNGETETGVTTFLIDEQIDTGNILLQQPVAIGTEETAGELHDRLTDVGAGLVLDTARQLAEGNLEPKAQETLLEPGVSLMKAPKIHREDCRIDWGRPGTDLFNLIRGLSPYPAAFTMLIREGHDDVLCKIYEASYQPADHQMEPGTVVTDRRRSMKAAVLDGYLQIFSIQQEGKRRMDIADFLAGVNLTSSGSRFS